MNLPLVSIITPYYNSLDTILETIFSVKNQSYQNIEHIIVNDGSPDKELFLKEIQTVKLPKNIRIVHKKNGGTSSAKNLGATFAQGKYICFLDADDILAPNFIMKCVEVLENKSEYSGVCSHYKHFDASNKLQKIDSFNYKTLLLKNTLPPITFIKLQDFRNYGPYDESLQIAEDWDLWISIFKHNPKVFLLNEILFFYRKHKSKTTLSDQFKSKEKLKKSYEYIYKKHKATYIEYFPDNYSYYMANVLKNTKKVNRNIRKTYLAMTLAVITIFINNYYYKTLFLTILSSLIICLAFFFIRNAQKKLNQLI